MRNVTLPEHNTATAQAPTQNGQAGLDIVTGGVGKPSRHESAVAHVSGSARYVDDMIEPGNCLHAAVIRSTIAAGQITRLDLAAVRNSPGVVAVMTVEDVIGHTDIGPVFPGDPLMTSTEVKFMGQCIAVVAATTELAARRAAQLAVVEYQQQTPLLDPREALAQSRLVRPSHSMKRGDLAAAMATASHILEAEQAVGGQEHFYLEGQVSLAMPAEDGGMLVYTSSQHPSEVQKLVAEVLDVPLNRITVDMRRMGGGFGGKESQAGQWACLAALLATRTGRAVKMRLPRQDDMVMTGKRHPFANRYRIGIDPDGQLLAAELEVIGNCGNSADLSDAIVDRAMFHADNAYYLPAAQIDGHRAFSNQVSHTAYRGFGGPQGMMIIERAMDDIARKVGQDPLTIRKRNLYGTPEHKPDCTVTPYHQTVEHNSLPDIIEQLEQSSDYWQRRSAITAWNKTSPVLKRGLALTPVKFGISFTLQHLNQAGALIHIYTDGSIQVNHGGTEMGQGLHTKVGQIVAQTLGVSLDSIQVTATRTDKVPNTSPTAASSGTDLNGKAAQNAALILKQRLVDFLAADKGVPAEAIVFANGQVFWAEGMSMSFAELAEAAYVSRVSLSTTGYYRTPKIHYDRHTASGRPFFYFANGAAVSEVVIDTLTGEYKVCQVDILHDVGQSINPAIDRGQIEGGFIQGMGWLTTEELVWHDDGRLLSNSPATYKIPAIGDTPPVFNVRLFEQANNEATVYNSKAVGEPPFMLAISVWSALRDAISSLSDYQLSPDLDTPATPERVLDAVMALQAGTGDQP
ncbi:MULTISPECIES: xanthine dehydrogenase molybdopterin binding subunit [unclassified Oceanobacter]|uniref:xanthine dehydrogenase molybdopterin binding subunit n=5 Tax=Gammaproteobacteria TaxID=1236 RepID=UPI002735CB27|nr:MULTISPECIES: xanthine dehydrogenase molybdopterin binding subunit [unclassified Oceanobacter]MDP2505896.1 xanthine dehydrogenase molybdopterin binding subunit [Oceanobacter sp. 3_MG-2023]MDP2548373.1 xanthine dehydrogenase molybdopterin binding subunit [Oceanobacter sp. 4_MG-2023]MDP2608374.1 xanthine dehydrogenase molybdopterin binding subunit [Oceanobacter sp. 1_MG-2023]MDP2611469.1 xanthine dehydrogenase molybdopterin binding subunit [Oceanobacter sp. 2_MG-2023]